MSGVKKQTMNWDAATNQKLLLAILAHHSELKLDYNGVANLMGPICSGRAIQEQIKKLRKDAKAGFDETNETFPGATANPDKGASNKAPRGNAGPKTNPNVTLKKAAPGDDGSVNAKPKAEEEGSRKKRKYNHPDATDAPASETIGSAMADAMHAAYEEAA